MVMLSVKYLKILTRIVRLNASYLLALVGPFQLVAMSKTCVTEKIFLQVLKQISQIIIATMFMKLSGPFGIVQCRLLLLSMALRLA